MKHLSSQLFVLGLAMHMGWAVAAEAPARKPVRAPTYPPLKIVPLVPPEVVKANLEEAARAPMVSQDLPATPGTTLAPANPGSAAGIATVTLGGDSAPAAPTLAIVAAPTPAEGSNNPVELASAQVYYGGYQCDQGQTVVVRVADGEPHHVELSHQRKTWVMKPVLSSTGAIRLEDVRGEMLMIQLGAKSMLLNTQSGKRVLDNCKSGHQQAHQATADPSVALGIGR